MADGSNGHYEIIQMRNVCKTFDRGKTVALNNVSLTVPQGQVVVIIAVSIILRCPIRAR